MNSARKLQELRKKPKDQRSGNRQADRRLAAKLAVFANRPSPALAERVKLRITMAADAELGQRELRLATDKGLSNPLVFDVGELSEFRKHESISGEELKPGQRPRDLRTPHAVPPEPEMNVTLPVTLNGQIMPGGVDRYRFTGPQGAATGRRRQRAKADSLSGRRSSGLVSGRRGDL